LPKELGITHSKAIATTLWLTAIDQEAATGYNQLNCLYASAFF